jgi:hypothetical protein
MANREATTLPPDRVKQSVDEDEQFPTLKAEKPWRVLNFQVEAGKLTVQVQDSVNNPRTLEFDSNELKRIQYIGTRDLSDRTRKLYAELIAPTGLPFAQQPNKIVYLGQIDSGKFPELQKTLEKGNISWIRYTSPLRENVSSLLPTAWGRQKI